MSEQRRFILQFRRVQTATAHVIAESAEEVRAAAKAELEEGDLERNWHIETEGDPFDEWEVSVGEGGDDLPCESTVHQGRIVCRSDLERGYYEETKPDAQD